MDFSVDRISRFSLLVIALALAWMALRPHLLPAPAEGARETVSINIERVGGRLLTTGTIPIRCGN
jgi:hypothetical protein